MQLAEQLTAHFGARLQACVVDRDEVTIEVSREDYLGVCQELRDKEAFQFKQLIDLCGVDYSQYGATEWETEDASSAGFSRGVDRDQPRAASWSKPRFAVVVHLLSVSNNQRIRVRVFVDEQFPIVASVSELWPVANWFEREAFDLFGILFDGHNDLRRLLTDYGFVGHPFRKDFPLIGNVEIRYDAAQARCVYEPVSIEPRVLVPRVIRHDQRYSAKKA
ncbi:MAG: NADH-quinone oxidoreductase subunit C [Permianibacter sp.]